MRDCDAGDEFSEKTRKHESVALLANCWNWESTFFSAVAELQACIAIRTQQSQNVDVLYQKQQTT
jgi:hypothetical protein